MKTLDVGRRLQDIEIMKDVQKFAMQKATRLASLSPDTAALLDSGMSLAQCKQAIQKKQAEAPPAVVNPSFGIHNSPYHQMLATDCTILDECIQGMDWVDNRLSGHPKMMFNHVKGRMDDKVLSMEAVNILKKRDVSIAQLVNRWEGDITSFMCGLHTKPGLFQFTFAPATDQVPLTTDQNFTCGPNTKQVPFQFTFAPATDQVPFTTDQNFTCGPNTKQVPFQFTFAPATDQVPFTTDQKSESTNESFISSAEQEKKSTAELDAQTLCKQLDLLEELLSAASLKNEVHRKQFNMDTFSVADMVEYRDGVLEYVIQRYPHAIKEAQKKHLQCEYDKITFHRQLARIWAQMEPATQEKLSRGVPVSTVVSELSQELVQLNRTLSKVPATFKFQ